MWDENARRQQPSRRVRSLLWNEIAALLNPGERDVVRKTIGAGLIEDNEILFREAVAYEEILQFMDEDMQRQIASHKILDTPARQMLEKEINLLVQHIQQSDDSVQEGASTIHDAGSSNKVGSPRKAVKDPLMLNGRCKNTLDYVLGKNAIQERQKCGTPLSHPLCGSGMFNRGNVPGELRKVAVDPALIVRKMAPHLNVTAIDAVNDRLRHAFAAEHVKSSPPTMNEMKDCGKKLEEKWAALKHCQNIQSILAPIDRNQVGGAVSTILTNSTVSTIPSDVQPDVSSACKRSIRLPKMH